MRPSARRRPFRAAAAAAALAGCALLGACGLRPDTPSAEQAAAVAGGDPAQGRRLVRAYGCDACHTVPGVRGAVRKVGPPLSGMGSRMFVAGLLANTPENLVLWIRDPPAVDPRTAMPDLGVTEQDARHIAAYLYTLR